MTNLQKPVSRAAEKRDKARAKAAHWQRVRRLVLARDGHRCRACGTGREPLDVHHVVRRSAGGKDTADNLIAACRSCHAETHAYRLFISGNANGPLRMSKTPSGAGVRI